MDEAEPADGLLLPENNGVLSRAEYYAREAELLAVVRDVSTDMLSSGTRGERDRLLAAALAGLLVSVFSVEGDTFGLAGLTFKYSPTLFPAGLCIVVIYLVGSFSMLAWTDTLRWRATVALILQSPRKWLDELNEQMAGIGQQHYRLTSKNFQKFEEYSRKITEKQAQVNELAKAYSNNLSLRPMSSVDDKISQLYKEMEAIELPQDENKELSKVLLEVHSNLFSSTELVSAVLKRRKDSLVMQTSVSIIFPIAFSLISIYLLLSSIVS